MAIVCSYCRCIIPDKSGIMHKSGEKKYCPNCNTLIAIRCLVCKKFIEKKALAQHMVNLHNYRVCKICNKTFPHNKLPFHLKNIHDYRQCKICKNLFNTKDFSSHIQKLMLYFNVKLQ